MSDIEELKRFLHENENLETLENIVDEFNIFTSLNIVSNEIRHSNFLSWLLYPTETHGFGDYFLKIFLKRVLSSDDIFSDLSIFDLDEWDLDDVEVEREWRNIDLLIRSDKNKFVCVIENKLKSKEHSRQLLRYKSIIDQEFSDYHKLFVYLTIEGETPSEDSYIPFSYSHIVELVEKLINNKRSKVSNDIIVFINHYKEMVRRYIVNDSEIQNICQRIYKNHKRALDLIFENKPDIYLNIYDVLADLIDKDPDLKLVNSSKTYIDFIPKEFDNYPKNRNDLVMTNDILLFELYNHSSGLTLYLYIGPGPQDIREKLYNIVNKNTTLFNMAKRTLSKKWSSIYKKIWTKEDELVDYEEDELYEILKKKLDRFKETDLPKIINELKDLEF